MAVITESKDAIELNIVRCGHGFKNTIVFVTESKDEYFLTEWLFTVNCQ